MDETPPDAEDNERYSRAIDEGRFADALAAASTGLMVQLRDLLAKEGINITTRRQPETAIELFGGIAATLKNFISEHPERATYKLEIAEQMAGALASLQFVLNRGIPDDDKATDTLAEIILQGMRVGAVAEHLGLTRAGHFDEFIQLASERDRMKSRQREAAERTNAAKGSARRQALDEAVRITRTNPALTNEDLAIKVHASTGLSTTVKTITGWVRGWRREGLVPPQKRPGR